MTDMQQTPETQPATPFQTSEQPKKHKSAAENKNIQLEVISAPDMQKQVLKNRYMISTPLDHGSFGSIHECIDLNKPKTAYVIKISENYEMLGREIEALSEIRKIDKEGKFVQKYSYTPRVISKGMFLFYQSDTQESEAIKTVEPNLVEESLREGKKFMSYYVMQKYGRNLYSIFEKHHMKFSSKTIASIGIKLVEIMKKIHLAGFTYNDLKLDNILVGDHENTEKSLSEIRVIDFGFAARYRTKSGKHIDQIDQDVFRSNMIFATINQFQFKISSRRDDLISLCYLLIFLYRGGNVPFIAHENLSKKDVFNFIYKFKKETSNEELLKGIQDNDILLQFMDEIFVLKFHEEPDYERLSQLLESIIIRRGQTLDGEYDWNSNQIAKQAEQTKVDKFKQQQATLLYIQQQNDLRHKEVSKVDLPNFANLPMPMQRRREPRGIVSPTPAGISSFKSKFQAYSIKHTGSDQKTSAERRQQDSIDQLSNIIKPQPPKPMSVFKFGSKPKKNEIECDIDMDELAEDEDDTLDNRQNKKQSQKQFVQYDFIRAQTFQNLDQNDILQDKALADDNPNNITQKLHILTNKLENLDMQCKANHNLFRQ